MSDVISVDVEPGYYTTDQTVNISFGPVVKEVSINLNGTPPSISKHIAYDNLSPPNPFISTSEDGQGRVLYDGSFPKLHNIRMGTSYLFGTKQYLLNALNWLADKSRPRKVLVLGDRLVESNRTYTSSVKDGVQPGGFNNIIVDVLASGDWRDSVIKERDDYPNDVLDARYSELSQYSVIWIVAADPDPGSKITSACVDALVQYRESGGGLFIMTDSAPDLFTFEEAVAFGERGGNGLSPYEHAATAVKISTRFGAWFSSDISREDIPFGYIRENFGDHEIWDGIPDDHFLPGVTDSFIIIPPNSTLPPDQAQSTYPLTLGHHAINIMSILDDGTLVPHKLEYSIVDYSMAFILDGLEVSSGQVFDAGSKDYITVSFEAIGTDVAMEGQLWIDEVMVGTVSKPLGGTPVFSPERTDRINGEDVIRINNNSVLSLRFSNPAGMEISSIIRRAVVSQSISTPLRYSEYGELLRSLLPEPSAPSRLQSNLDENDIYLRLPKAIDVSKAHMSGPYGNRIADFVVDVANFVVGNVSWRGFFLHQSMGGDGTITPDTIGSVAIRDMNASLPEPLELQVGFPKGEPTPPLPVAIYIDNIGPLYRSRSRIDDNGNFPAQRYFYTNGVSNIYNYLGTKIGQKVEFRFIYPSP